MEAQDRADALRRLSVHRYWRDKHEAGIKREVRECVRLGMSIARLGRILDLNPKTVRDRYLRFEHDNTDSQPRQRITSKHAV